VYHNSSTYDHLSELVFEAAGLDLQQELQKRGIAPQTNASGAGGAGKGKGKGKSKGKGASAGANGRASSPPFEGDDDVLLDDDDELLEPSEAAPLAGSGSGGGGSSTKAGGDLNDADGGAGAATAAPALVTLPMFYRFFPVCKVTIKSFNVLIGNLRLPNLLVMHCSSAQILHATSKPRSPHAAYALTTEVTRLLDVHVFLQRNADMRSKEEMAAIKQQLDQED
jgi:hypothetical protein